tara:strand:+ start:427 stop:627 length:201 start_codon:yes stop_codon:yes gene_type:complete
MITPTQTHTYTSDDPYNRHKYKIVFVDGRSIVIDDYGKMKQTWTQFSEVCSHVVVLDKKKSGGRGF